MLNPGAELLHLQPRDELDRLRGTSLFPPRPAGNSLNEQHARAQLHALNEADIGAAPAQARGLDPAPTRLPPTTHWTRILHYDLYAGCDAVARADDGAAPARTARRNGMSGLLARSLGRLADSLFGWLAA